MNKYINKLNLENIAMYQKLSESFIEQHKEKLNWYILSEYQKLSEEFIERHIDKVNLAKVSAHQKLSKTFIKKYKDRLWIGYIRDSWHYKSVKNKKQKIIETRLYECYDDYFIAYKGIRFNRYSNFNFQYKYEKGGIYEAWADVSSEGDSFGLSAWTEEDAKRYCPQKVVKVKIRYEDVARVVHNGGKIRCFKIEVLE